METLSKKTLNVDDYRRFRFTCKRGSFETSFNLVAMVAEIDNKYVTLIDNDGYEYKVKIENIKSISNDLHT